MRLRQEGIKGKGRDQARFKKDEEVSRMGVIRDEDEGGRGEQTSC